jgi:hypothetical protein
LAAAAALSRGGGPGLCCADAVMATRPITAAMIKKRRGMTFSRGAL